MMMKGVVKIAKILSPVAVVVKANKNPTRFGFAPTFATLVVPPLPPPYTTQDAAAVNGNGNGIGIVPNFNEIDHQTSKLDDGFELHGNPCLDLYEKVNKQPGLNLNKQILLLKQLLPLAWSHNPNITLKLICDLSTRYEIGRRRVELFYRALIWLHHNHPKTLACNVEAIAGDSKKIHVFVVGHLEDFVEILYRLLLPLPLPAEDCNKANKAKAKAADHERYERDPNYRFLHDRVSDVFADYLRADIEKLKNKKPNEQLYWQDFSSATGFIWECVAPSHRRTKIARASTLLAENVARKVFPEASDQDQDQDQDHTKRKRVLVKRLMKEVLEPIWALDSRPPGLRTDSVSLFKTLEIEDEQLWKKARETPVKCFGDHGLEISLSAKKYHILTVVD